MNPPSFWWRRLGPTALALRPAASIWGAAVARRMVRSPDYWAPVPVICVGNFTAGGEGKTPTAIAIGGLVRDLGLKPGFLTRGYGGDQEGPIVVTGEHRHPRRVGDEPCLLADLGPTVVSGNRPQGARLLIEQDIDLIIMDDGFQNPHLGKDLSVIAADSAIGFGNGLVMPAGPLRAPLKTQLRLADAIVLIGRGAAQARMVRVAAKGGRQVLRADLMPVSPDRWREGKLFAFAGIGRPEKFFDSLEQQGAQFVGRNAYPDHHFFTEEEARSLLGHANAGDIRLVTTEKDHARLGGAEGVLAELRERTEVFSVRLEFEMPDAVRRLIVNAVEAVRSRGERRASVFRS